MFKELNVVFTFIILFTSTLLGCKSSGTSAIVTAANNAAATPTPALVSSDTSAIDGKYDGPCFPFEESDGIYGMQIIQGNLYTILLSFTSTGTQCTGTKTMIDPITSLQINSAPDSTTIDEITMENISGIPVNTYVYSITRNSVTHYSVLTFEGNTLYQLYDATTTNWGNQWSQWTTGDTDIAGFLQNSSTFTPTQNGASWYFYTKVNSFKK